MVGKLRTSLKNTNINIKICIKLHSNKEEILSDVVLLNFRSHSISLYPVLLANVSVSFEGTNSTPYTKIYKVIHAVLCDLKCKHLIEDRKQGMTIV